MFEPLIYSGSNLWNTLHVKRM